MAIGSLGPWVDTIIGSVSGTHGDGQITLGAAACAFLFTLMTARSGGVVLAGLASLSAIVGGAVGLYDFQQLHDATSDATLLGTQVAQVGWGLYAVIGGAVVVIGGIAASARR